LRKTFPFRSCTGTINGTKKQPCLNFHIHRCPGPCIGAISSEEYTETLDQIILFLEGKQETVRRELNKKMEAASRQLQFEKAALLRDQLQAIEEIVARQRTATSLKGEQDVIALAQDNKQAYVEVFFIRGGKITGHSHFIMEGTSDEEPAQVLTSFVKQYYSAAPHIPPTILLQYPVYETPVLNQWLKKKRGGSVKLLTPQKGGKKQLLRTVEENAVRGLHLAGTSQRVEQDLIIAGLRELKEKLQLPRIPVRIECYDISCTQGTLPTGSMAVMEKGVPSPSQYRCFRIRSVNQIDDYAMIQEVLRRRFRKVMNKGAGYRSITPDLVLIDGGKGHLNAAFSVLQEYEAGAIPVASIAKQNEDIFVPGKAEPIDLAKNSSGQSILQRARDEAHRFAVAYHRKLRSRTSTASLLDSVSGIGPKRRNLLIKKFGSVKAIKEIPAIELAKIPGISPPLARKIKEL
jgi:excinuclease ABC subunit C